MSLSIKGKLYKKFEAVQVTDSFKKREFVILTDEDSYPQHIKFELAQSKCSIIDGFKEGDIIDVSFDLRGREWNDKFFTNINAWKVLLASEDLQSNQDGRRSLGEPQQIKDDLPF